MIDKRSVITKYLAVVGREVTLVKEDGSRTDFFAVTDYTWRKTKTKFEDEASKIGRVKNEYYTYYGPAAVDITALGRGDFLEIDGVPFFFVKKEVFKVGGRIQFYSGIIKKAEEDDGDVFI